MALSLAPCLLLIILPYLRCLPHQHSMVEISRLGSLCPLAPHGILSRLSTFSIVYVGIQFISITLPQPKSTGAQNSYLWWFWKHYKWWKHPWTDFFLQIHSLPGWFCPDSWLEFNKFHLTIIFSWFVLGLASKKSSFWSFHVDFSPYFLLQILWLILYIPVHDLLCAKCKEVCKVYVTF